MPMAKFDVDGPNLLLIAKPGVTAVDVKVDLYSDAKEHWIATADSKFNFPLRTVGGDPIGGGKFAGDLYFLTNGWKIRPQEADHELLLDGNLFLDDGEAGGIFVPTVGNFTVLATIERSADVRALETGGASPDWTDTEKAQMRYRLGIDGSSSIPAAVPSISSKVMSSLAYEETASILDVNIWLERDGRMVPSATSASATFRDSDGVQLFAPLTDSSPDSQGVFRVTKASPGFGAGEQVYIELQIVAPSGTFSTIRGLQVVG
jgi:hypothetical protein